MKRGREANLTYICHKSLLCLIFDWGGVLYRTSFRWPVFIGEPPLDKEDSLAGCLEDLWEEGGLGIFLKAVIEWIKGNPVDTSMLVH